MVATEALHPARVAGRPANEESAMRAALAINRLELALK